jgi:hypothetical protein
VFWLTGIMVLGKSLGVATSLAVDQVLGVFSKRSRAVLVGFQMLNG